MSVIEHVEHALLDGAVQGAEIDDEAGLLVRGSRHPDPQSIVMSVTGQVGAGAEVAAVLFLGPLGTPVEMAGAESIAADEADHASGSRQERTASGRGRRRVAAPEVGPTGDVDHRSRRVVAGEEKLDRTGDVVG